MTEYKVIINEEQVEVSALYIEAITFERIDVVALETVVNKWLKTIGFINSVTLKDKLSFNNIYLEDNEKVTFIDNGVQITVVAYHILHKYDICEHKKRNKHNK